MQPAEVDAEVTVAGPLAAVAAWVTGRLPADRRKDVLVWTGGTPEAAPRWI